MNNEIEQEEFLRRTFELLNQRVITDLKFRGLSANYRGNVMELPLTNIKGCHYEIGIHKDCHEIALHFQGSAENNKFRSESSKPFKQQIEAKLGLPVIIGDHEKSGVRKRLWVRLPLASLTSDLENQYSEIAFNLIVSTLTILQTIIDKESIAKNRD